MTERRLDRMSLRTRLVAAMVGLFAVGLFLALGATRAALQDARRDMISAGVGAAITDELIGRVTGVAVVSTVVALVLVAGLTWMVIGRGLRPLEDIAVTAASIDTAASGTRIVVPTGPPEIRQLAEGLNTMLAQLEDEFERRRRSEERLRRFVADASHELRTPIATVRGYAELFRRGAGADPAELERILARIESEAERMGGLVDELLLLARLDQGRPLDRHPVDLRALVLDAVSAAHARQPERGWRVAAEDAVIVVGDSHRLRQVIDNLLANVVSHTPSSASATVTLSSVGSAETGSSAAQTARLTVRDTGPGLADADRARAFDRFYRAAGAAGHSRSGSGLGLSIVAAVIDAHGGSTRLESVPGIGTTVTIELPSPATTCSA